MLRRLRALPQLLELFYVGYSQNPFRFMVWPFEQNLFILIVDTLTIYRTEYGSIK